MTLFVCTANICRSPIAERLALSVWGTGSPIAVISAGTHATAGRPMAAEAADALRELGGDPEGSSPGRSASPSSRPPTWC